MNKELAEYTFNELVDHCTWLIIQGIVSGDRLRTAVFSVCDLCAQWRKAIDGKQAKEEKL
jgi:hypothetical protein